MKGKKWKLSVKFANFADCSPNCKFEMAQEGGGEAVSAGHDAESFAQ